MGDNYVSEQFNNMIIGIKKQIENLGSDWGLSEYRDMVLTIIDYETGKFNEFYLKKGD